MAWLERVAERVGTGVGGEGVKEEGERIEGKYWAKHRI